MNHPGIIKFVEKFETKTHLYIINELVDGGDLYEYVKLNSFMSGLLLFFNHLSLLFQELDAAKVIKLIVESIIYLHNTDIVHNDIKP